MPKLCAAPPSAEAIAKPSSPPRNAHAAGVGVGTVYRRFPDKEELIDALFEQSINRIAALAEEGVANPDPWAGLVGFFERALEEQARHRGLKELLLSDAHGRERVALGRARIPPRVEALVARAQASGDLRPDVMATDLPLIQLMLGAALDYTREVARRAAAEPTTRSSP
jgi:AcrR family transcriptional regulator